MMVNGRFMWRYLFIAAATCFIVSFFTWYKLSNSGQSIQPILGESNKEPGNMMGWDKKHSISLSQDIRLADIPKGIIDLNQKSDYDEPVTFQWANRSYHYFETGWLPIYYIEKFKNDPSMSYLRERIVQYCNPPEEPVTGEEGKVPSGYVLQSVHVIIRHGDRTPLENVNDSEGANINCNLLTVSKETPDLLFQSLGMNVNKWKGLLQKDYHPTLKEMNMKTALQYSAISSLNFNHVTALVTDRVGCRTSQLTPTGWRQHLNVGAFLRRAYERHKLINYQLESYKDVMLLQSTYFSRTMQSAIALLYGLLPDEEILKTPHLKIYRMFNFCQGSMCDCPLLLPLLNEVSEEKRRHKLEHKYTKDISKTIKNILYDKNIAKKLPHFFALLDQFTSFLCHGQKLPCGSFKCIDLELVQNVFKYVDTLENDLKYKEEGASMKHARLFMYPLLSEITEAIRFNKTSHRFSLYSGHDLTITPILGILGFPDFRWPNYAARIVFEGWSKVGSMFIRVLYNGVDMTSRLRFCQNKLNKDGLCPLQELINFVEIHNFSFFGGNSYKEVCNTKL